MSFFGVGPFEILVIFIVALLVFGPDRLPQAAMQLGRWVGQFRRWSADITTEFREVTKEFSSEFEELRSVTADLQAELRGVQADLANEMRQVAALSEGAAQDEVTQYGVPGSGSQTWAPASPGAVVPTADSNGTQPEVAMSAPLPPAATKEDPRVDVSVFDLEEVVLMPRSPRPSNGHVPVLDVPPSEPDPRPQRQARPRRPGYARPLQRAD
jgi:sec-independent protein translocase protein TatB